MVKKDLRPLAPVNAGGNHTCGLRPDGSITCWGRDDNDQSPTQVVGVFTSESAGVGQTCGVRIDGYVVCWGSQARGLTSSEGR